MVSILAGMPGIRSVYAARSGVGDIREDGREPYDACFVVPLVSKVGPHKKVRYTNLYKAPDPSHRGNLVRSEADVCLDVVRGLGWSGEMPAHYVAVSPYKGELPPTPLVGIGAGGKANPYWRWKRYPRYAEVVEHVLEKDPQVHFVLVGVETDDGVPHNRVLDLRGKTSVREVADVLSRCSSFVGNDCGQAHIAAALGVPTTVVFGPTERVKNLPPRNARAVFHGDLACQPCQYSSQGMGRYPGSKTFCAHECMRELETERVVQSVMDDLSS